MTQLHIGVSPHRGALFLAKILPKFNEAFPQVKLVVHEGYALQLKELLAQGKVDYVITGLPSENEQEFRTLPLHNEEVVLGVPSYHRIAKNYTGSIDCLPYIDLAELKDSYFVMPELPSTLYQVIKPLFERAGFQPLSAFASANIVMAEAMIRSGVGIGFLPASYMRPGKDVVYYRLYQPVYMASSVLMRKGHEMSKAERYLTFLQLQVNSLNPHYHMDWSDTILAIVREFDYTHYFEPYMEL